MEARDFILKLLDESIMVTTEKYPKSIFNVYDKQLLREKKLNRITSSNQESVMIFDYKDIKDKIVFEQDYENGYFWFDNYKVTSVLKEKYNYNYQQIIDLVDGILKEYDKLMSLTSNALLLDKIALLKEYDKLMSLTSCNRFSHYNTKLKDNDKLMSLKSSNCFIKRFTSLKDDDKLKSLTPNSNYLIYFAKLKDDDKLKSFD